MSALLRAIVEELSSDPDPELLAQLVDLLGSSAADQEPEPTSPYLTVAEAAEFLRCKPQRVHDLLSMGRLTRCKEGGRTLVIQEEVAGLVVVERTRRLRAA